MVQTPIQIRASFESWIELLMATEFMLSGFIFKQNINMLMLKEF